MLDLRPPTPAEYEALDVAQFVRWRRLKAAWDEEHKAVAGARELDRQLMAAEPGQAG